MPRRRPIRFAEGGLMQTLLYVILGWFALSFTMAALMIIKPIRSSPVTPESRRRRAF
jgi:hypothetical protein